MSAVTQETQKLDRVQSSTLDDTRQTSEPEQKIEPKVLAYADLTTEQKTALENNLIWRFLEDKAKENKAFAAFYRRLFSQCMLKIKQRGADWQRWLVDKVWQSPKLDEDHKFFDSLGKVERNLLLDFLEVLEECRRSYFEIVHNNEGKEGILHEYAGSKTRIYKDGSSFCIA